MTPAAEDFPATWRRALSALEASGITPQQRAFVRLSDPLGTGADWLGTGGLQVSYAAVTPTIVANVQVVAIVVGHVLGVVVAHDRAISLFPRSRAVAGQVPLLVLMVTLTCLGLFLLFWD